MLMSELCRVAVKAAARGHVLRPRNENGRIYVCVRCQADISLDRKKWALTGAAIHNDCVDMRVRADVAATPATVPPEQVCA